MACDLLLLKNEAGCLIPRDALFCTRKSVSGQQLIRLALRFCEEVVDSEPGSSAEPPSARALGRSCSWRREEVPKRERVAHQAKLSPRKGKRSGRTSRIAHIGGTIWPVRLRQGQNSWSSSCNRSVSTRCMPLFRKADVWIRLGYACIAVRRVLLPEVTAMLVEPLGVPDAPLAPAWSEPIRLATETGRARELGETRSGGLTSIEAHKEREGADRKQRTGAAWTLKEYVSNRARLSGRQPPVGALVWAGSATPRGDAAVTGAAALLSPAWFC